MAVGFSSPYGIPLARSSKSAASDRTHEELLAIGSPSVDHDGSHHSHRSGHMATEHSAALVEMELAIQRELQRLGGEVDFMSPADFEAASAALRSTLRAHAEHVERLELLAAAQERPADEATLREHARRHTQEARTLASSLRSLAAQARGNRGRIEAAERAALFCR